MTSDFMPFFLDACKEELNRDLSKNLSQLRAVTASPDASLFITAGPGSGKTTVLALKVLKFIFVDDMPPECIMATTFTRKAAKELRSRILGWGDQLKQHFKRRLSLDQQGEIQRFDSLNFNLVTIGTLDSIAQEKLGQYRKPGTQPPLIIDDFASTSAMIKAGLFQGGLFRSVSLHKYLANLNGGEYGLDTRKKASILKQINERFKHDRIDRIALERTYQSDQGAQKALQAIAGYEKYLAENHVHDYADLESQFLDGIQNGSLDKFVSILKVLLVDEYQDTNLLQQDIYFEIAKCCKKNRGGLTVVGDDDQSIFRFRGATVEVFSNFKTNAEHELDIHVEQINLIDNYRSMPAIVCSVNNFINLDRRFQEARVNKPEIIASREFNDLSSHHPVLCLFRKNKDELAAELTKFIMDVQSTDGYRLNNGQIIKFDPEGSVNDIAVLSRTALDHNSSGKPRLPFLLRENLSQCGINVFNPRGTPLKSVRSVKILLGLMLECIDPDAGFQSEIKSLPPEAIDIFPSWRKQAQDYISDDLPSANSESLARFVKAWRHRRPTRGSKWLSEVALNDLIYKLMTWVPGIYDDIEGLVYLEAITRTVNQAGLFSKYNSNINFYSPKAEFGSIKAIYWDILVPIATGAVEIDEDLLETLPKNRLNIMTIWQAKGLEYPLVIVDIGSDFSREHWTQAQFRYPSKIKLEHRLEDQLREFSPINLPQRNGLDRAFDDLYRLYYVALSRAQDVLLIVGLETSLSGKVRNVAAGWDRENEFKWNSHFQHLKECLCQEDADLLLI